MSAGGIRAVDQPIQTDVAPAELLRRRAQAFCDRIVAEAPGMVRAAFLGGSAGRGEVWAARVDGSWEIYSDLDIYLVSSSSSAAGLRARGAVAAAALPTADEGARFLRGADVGVYTLDDLERQPARPGTVGLAAHSYWLGGDRSVLERLARRMRPAIAHDEALYLLENRVRELNAFATVDVPVRERQARVAALKACLDVATAHLIADGRFAETIAERAALIRERSPATMSPECRSAVFAAESAYRDLNRAVHEGDAREALRRASDLVLNTWVDLVRSIRRAPNAAVDELVLHRCGRGKIVSNYHEFLRMRHAFRLSLARSLWSGIGLSFFSPHAVLRASSLVLAFGAGRSVQDCALQRYMDRLTRTLGFAQGTLSARAVAAHRMVS